jgi:membrane-associated phospholipid phosphatase
MQRNSVTWRRQLLLFASAYVAYNVGRWLTAGDEAVAVSHAHAIIGFERSLGFAVEDSVQGPFDSGLVSAGMSYIYLAAQLVVVPAALVWLYRRSSAIYPVLRDTVLATWLISIPAYALFPVAPPRLADARITDTVSHASGVGLTGRSTIFYNEFAAVPSLHVGFAFAVSIALALAFRDRRAKVLALLWCPLVALVVVATGNHYVFDIVAGLAATIAGFVVARLASTWGPRLVELLTPHGAQAQGI